MPNGYENENDVNKKINETHSKQGLLPGFINHRLNVPVRVTQKLYNFISVLQIRVQY